jgi:NAD(P)-dependent dehydrogenase (short-subunit alcohol dehydrogenase family)
MKNKSISSDAGAIARVALVTGATRDIGAAIAKSLAESGAKSSVRQRRKTGRTKFLQHSRRLEVAVLC